MFLLPFLKFSFHLNLCLYVDVYIIDISDYVVISLSVLQIVTSAVYSNSIKSIFACAVIGSQGVVTNSINITAVCSVGTLVNI